MMRFDEIEEEEISFVEIFFITVQYDYTGHFNIFFFFL